MKLDHARSETDQTQNAALKPNESKRYWDEVSRSFTKDGQQLLWRSHSDRVNIDLLEDWFADRQFSDILKTDLFDETLRPGLYPFLQEHARSVHGIDIAPEVVDAAKTRFPDLEAVCADVRDLQFNDDHFDLVVSNSTLDHFQNEADIDTALGELYRVLKTNGELLISLDNLQNPIIFLRSLLPFQLLNKLHLVPYFVGKTHARRGLVAALERAGFRVLETRPIMHCPRVFAVAIAEVLQKRASATTQKRFLSLLSKFESLAKLPTRYFTGHFVAVRAIKPEK